MNNSTELARIAIQEFLAVGVRDVVISPGSRSTPLALQLAALERSGNLTLHVRFDERSAAFLALGISKSTGVLVPVVCTSGTAVANLMPAVVEAAYSGVPLVTVTADRPERLRNVGANQTIDQVGIFGHQVLASIDVTATGGSFESQRKRIAQILQTAVGNVVGDAGPIQINLAFDTPLVPGDVLPLVASPGAVDFPARTYSLREPIDFVMADLGIDRLPERGVIVCGDVPNPEVAQQAKALAAGCGWPIICEPSGNTLDAPSAIPHASVLLADRSFRGSHIPELVLTIGRFGISRPTVEFVQSANHHVAIRIGGKDRPDPCRTAGLVLEAVPRVPEVPIAADTSPWLAEWLSASTEISARHDLTITEDEEEMGDVTGASDAREVWRCANESDYVFPAASRTVRYFEALATTRPDVPWVLGNRGASGIDGLVSTAWGAAIGHERTSGGRTIAVLGDLAFLHDQNGLLAPAAEPRPPLTVVVVANDGGGIFSSLEQAGAEFEQDFERVFGTPHGLDIEVVARASGVPTIVARTRSELREALMDESARLRVVVIKTDRRVEQRQWESLLHPADGSKD